MCWGAVKYLSLSCHRSIIEKPSPNSSRTSIAWPAISSNSRNYWSENGPGFLVVYICFLSSPQSMGLMQGSIPSITLRWTAGSVTGRTYAR
jgi:hypothetical protein